MQKKPKVLFLSRGNATRGQMAEGLLRTLAGTGSTRPARNRARNAKSHGYRGDEGSRGGYLRQQAKNVKELLKEHFAYVITVCDLGSRAGANISVHAKPCALEYL